MKISLLLVFVLITTLLQQAGAQNRTISGRITDRATNKGLPGVTVLAKGTAVGTSTNADGVYTLSVPDAASALVFSFIEYASQEQTIGSASTINAALATDSKQLSEVVVNALGFDVEKNKVGFASSKVTGAQVVKSGEVSLIDALGGKAAGVRISRSSGSDPGSGSQILIRGQSTITRGTEPLIVLDGVPMNSGTRGEANNGVTQQNRLSDINPDDIASIQVLKGASAAALWGTRAANGVLMITTKRGSSDDATIAFKSAFSLDEVNRKYRLQTAYGQGIGGVWRRNNSRSWGDKIASRSGEADVPNTTGEYFRADDGTIHYPITTKNSQETFTDKNYDDVFGKGCFLGNSLSISGGNKASNYFFSLSDLKQEGVIRSNSDYRRSSVRLNVDKDLNRWLTVSNKATYVLTSSNRVRRGASSGGVMLGLLRTPTDFDNSDYRGAYAPSPTGALTPDRQRAYRLSTAATTNPGFNNPLWTIYEQDNTSKVNRFINSAELTVKPVDWGSITLRSGVDYFTDLQLNYLPPTSVNAPAGAYGREVFDQMQFNVDLIGRAERKLNEHFAVNGLVGFNLNTRNEGLVGGNSLGFVIPNGPRDLNNANAANLTITDRSETTRNNAGYASVGAGFCDQVFVNLTGRLEAASTFGALANNRFFYPAADVAWNFSNLPFLKESQVFSFGKLRAAYGIVGIQPNAYNTATNYFTPNWAEALDPNLDATLFGTGTYVESRSKGNPLLRPERKQDFEIGTDLRFFSNKVQTSLSYYQNKTTDALLNIPLTPSTGYTSLYANAGAIQNKGVEAELSYTALQTASWGLALDANWTMNRNEVLNLNGATSVDLGGLAGVSSRAVVGQPLGALWSNKFLREEDGALALDANGFPQLDPVQSVIGNPNPDWRGGFGARLTYKGFGLYALLEHSQGGDIVDATEAVLLDYGTSAATGTERTAGTGLRTSAGTVIPAGTPFRGNIQNFGAGDVALTESWYTGRGGYFGNILEPFVTDATWTRLREVTLSYNHKFTDRFLGAKSVGVDLSGRNLLLISKLKSLDPDSNLDGSGSARGIAFFNNPSTRSYLLTLRANF